jgi:hypothetical protein
VQRVKPISYLLLGESKKASKYYEPYERRQNKLTNARKVLLYMLTISIFLTELYRNRLRNLISSLTRLEY